MELHFKQLVPIPLSGSVKENSSDIWLKDIYLHKGERVWIQAPTGGGKTLLLKTLYGLLPDYRGEVWWGTQELGGMTKRQLASLRAGFVSAAFQHPDFFQQLTVRENLEVKRMLTNTVSEEHLTEMLKEADIFSLKNRKVRDISIGEQQCVALIRCLLQPFDWLLLDDPFSLFDTVLAERMAALIAKIVTLNNAGLLLCTTRRNAFFTCHRHLFL